MRILALVGGHALAHVSRPLEALRPLAAQGHEVTFAGAGPYLGVAAAAGHPVVHAPYVDTAAAVRLVKQGRYGDLFPEDALLQAMAAERTLIEDLRPDLVLADDRLTAASSAELLGIPCASIANVHMSMQRRIPFTEVGPGLPRPLRRAVDPLVNAGEMLFWDRVVLRGLRAARSRLGLPRRRGYAMAAGDLCLFPDIPAFNPARPSPATVYVGPLTWRNPARSLDLAARVQDGRTNVYLSLGSDALVIPLERLAGIACSGIRLLIATGSPDPPLGLPDHDAVIARPTLNADDLLPHCRAVVCHGGNGTIYQALRHGLPVVGFSAHAEQAYGLRRCRDLGLGTWDRAADLGADGAELVLGRLQQALGDAGMRARAAAFARVAEPWADAPQRAAAALLRLAAGRGRAAGWRVAG